MIETQPTGVNRLYVLIGFPLAHSFSERYFNDKFKREGIENTEFKSFSFENIDDIRELIFNHPNPCASKNSLVKIHNNTKATIISKDLLIRMLKNILKTGPHSQLIRC